MSERAIFFDAVLEPNQPLPARWLVAIMLAVALISFVAGILFVLQGAWPVTPFFGADVLLLGLAFRASRKAARRRERLVLTHEAFTVTRTAPDGATVREEINPYWLRVDHHDPEGIGAELALVTRGRRIVIGNFLGAEDRCTLAEALREALARARNTLPAA
jgi:uncharacterized membrane protein